MDPNHGLLMRCSESRAFESRTWKGIYPLGIPFLYFVMVDTHEEIEPAMQRTRCIAIVAATVM